MRQIPFSRKPRRIKDGIPRFVPENNYARSFSIEWARHASLRFDSDFVKKKILARTGWSTRWLKGKTILECGCGGGNDTKALLDLGAQVAAFDLSTGVEQAKALIGEHPGLLGFFQASIMDIPVKSESFDIVFCHRVLQHTPDPKKAFFEMARIVKPGGTLFMHSYDKSWQNLTHWRYRYRWLTKRMKPETLARLIEKHGPWLYRLVVWMDRWWLGRAIHHCAIPFWNYERGKMRQEFTREQRYQWACMNTFDSLSPAHDHPTHPRTMRRWFEEAGFTRIRLRRRNPVIMIGMKKRKKKKP
ncbi:class I SAM-dependent methyltransferase [Candidatus Woesearchaeota archaeon]|nr:MAG: class I SAM-dependent methyltransferase [Candidatus Woesearchaeota archaeon]